MEMVIKRGAGIEVLIRSILVALPTYVMSPPPKVWDSFGKRGKDVFISRRGRHWFPDDT